MGTLLIQATGFQKPNLIHERCNSNPSPHPHKKVLQWRKLLQKLGTKTDEAAFVQILTCWLVPWVISNKTLATCKKQFPLVNFSTVWLHYSFVLGCFSALRTPVTILKLFKFGEKKNCWKADFAHHRKLMFEPTCPNSPNQNFNPTS